MNLFYNNQPKKSKRLYRQSSLSTSLPILKQRLHLRFTTCTGNSKSPEQFRYKNSRRLCVKPVTRNLCKMLQKVQFDEYSATFSQRWRRPNSGYMCDVLVSQSLQHLKVLFCCMCKLMCMA